ncbi:hypothetical protein PR202_ga17027 [Eleusine coracana subsp. coracana]|uniref:H(+)/Pi cotransporter n=1 Tax=Eleusine coracana subsp. coracana TaxID=191504 RepID=A0AAV5CNE1_ELECO|nr:hypothetical protein PR202_ga17027 [Eleusine coracana subsp. coracana]
MNATDAAWGSPAIPNHPHANGRRRGRSSNARSSRAEELPRRRPRPSMAAIGVQVEAAGEDRHRAAGSSRATGEIEEEREERGEVKREELEPDLRPGPGSAFTALVEHDVAKATNDIGRVLTDLNLMNAITEDEAEEPALRRSTPSLAAFRPPRPYSLFSRRFLKQHGRDLFACASAWFILDIPYYSSTLFQSQIYRPWFPPASRVNAFQEAFNVAKFQAIIAVASTIPGYFVAVLLIDRVGRRKLQTAGFLLMAVFLFALAGPYDHYWKGHATDAWYIVLYALTFFSANLGPNTTTFILPAELFPARFRSTCHGFSGAAGKLGAVIGSIGFLWASQERDRLHVQDGYRPGIGMMYALIILGGISLVGLAVTYMFTPETMGRSLEENEVQRGQQTVVGNGDGRQRFHQELITEMPKSPASTVSSHLSSSPIIPHRFSV